ncbi:GLPGLI family protein [Chryseobacterium cheonjiense]|uniref:GLPGLI family protein n=1 Tax=Chryseobacterium cheonjiense TaxID=2728845 RepID=A0A7Y0A755_9FLAO|nr:GLPGLI family protein [Chryseobacterium cheonjiense]NML57963.1 GLPGLI family protein [Chryseobacterium cheonjiense]
MKRFLLVMMMFSISLTAQTHRFIYEYHFKTDSTTSEKRKVSMVLDVNPENVKFYNYDFVVTDSINKTRGENNVIWDDTPALTRKRNSTINSNYIMIQNMFLVETNDKIDWDLDNETKTIGGYNVQKATAKFGGRNWTAWFTKDISLNEGPYKFRGLPGMIFEIYDDKDNFKFSLVKSYKISKTYETLEILEKFGGQNPIKIPESRLKKMMLDYYNDPLHTFKEHYKNNTNPAARFMVMGVEVRSPEQFKELSEMMQKNIKRNNNPIEIDKAIRYN